MFTESRDREKSSAMQNIRWGVRWGRYGAAGFAAIAAIPAFLRFVSGTTSIESYRAPAFWELCAVYLGAGIFAGVVFGLLRPLLRWWVGRRLVSILAAAPLGFCMRLMAYPGDPWNAATVRSDLMFAVVWGFMVSFANGDWPFTWLTKRRS